MKISFFRNIFIKIFANPGSCTKISKHCNVLAALSRLPPRPTCPVQPVSAVLSQLSGPRRPVQDALSWPVCPDPSVLTRLSLPVCPDPFVLTHLSWPICPDPSLLSQLSCPSCPVTAALPRPPCQMLFWRHCHVLPVLSKLSCSIALVPSSPSPQSGPCRHVLSSRPLCPVLTDRYHVPDVVSQLYSDGCPATVVLFKLFRPSFPVLLSCSGYPGLSFLSPAPSLLSSLSCPGCPAQAFLSQLICPGIFMTPALMPLLSCIFCDGFIALSCFVLYALSCPVNPILTALYWLSCPGCPGLSLQGWPKIEELITNYIINSFSSDLKVSAESSIVRN